MEVSSHNSNHSDLIMNRKHVQSDKWNSKHEENSLP